MALHAKAKAEAGYRFYALYDKISREDILAHAYAQCRSNKGAPGIDGQDFADIEAYGVERWLTELALALRQETYRPEPIRRVFIPKANGKLRPLGISSVRDRVCMTAATLVLEPIFEADLPPEQYAYRPGRSAQQAAVEVEELLFRGHREVVDADLADFLKAASYCPPAYEVEVKQRGLGGYSFDPQAFLLSPLDMDGFELAALDTLQHGLTRDAEKAHRLVHGEGALRLLIDKASAQILGQANAPRSCRGQLLTADEAVIEPAMDG